ncbi:MMPL family transporter [Geomonas sp. RF6]|uniref:MMPL family transporter n=1 Tax=Geomonas sp. RF6 TaxID=2897342 RepID=UPI001E59BD21|nr:MMPL family transporter [Geomonas sp. RF6]UFS69364.1 MMPL family transporter [Geomonas sp. RF6]
MPVPSCTIFERLYRFLATRRRALFGTTILLVILATLASTRLHIEEDIAAMLPDDGSSVAKDFELLQLAPFTRKVVITLSGGEGTDPATLSAAADRLAASLAGAGVSKVTTGPDSAAGGLFRWLGSTLGSLAGEEELSRLGTMSTGAEVQKRLRASYESLLSPEGWALKGSIQNDPLSFSAVAMEKMRFLNMIPHLRLVDNHFMSADGKNALVVLDSTVSMTDSDGSRKLLERIRQGVAKSLPQGVSATVISGHRYTLVNADTIKGDLALILTVTSVAVLGIYFFFLRSLSAVFVFLVPSSILVIASGVMACLDSNVYALTLGFGGVLLGIADEYAMLIYFSCRQGGKDIGTITGEVARPVLFGAAATLLSFGVMMISALPGQRELAIYSMIGIVASVAISLVVLPHLVKPLPQAAVPAARLDLMPRLPRRLVIGVWLGILLLCGWQTTKVRFNGKLSAVSMVTSELKEAEDQVAKTWGDVRGKALVFAEGPDLDAALAVNDRLFARLGKRFAPGELVSIAPLLPSSALQEENRQRWISYWKDGRAARLAADLGREGEALGFSGDAFKPFLERLSTPPPAATEEGMRAAGMEELVNSLIVRSPGGVRVLTMVPDTPEAIASLSEELKGIPGVRLVSQTRFATQMSGAIVHDFTRYLTITCILVFALVAIIFRNPRRIALVLVPVVTGLVCSLGIMGMLGMEFNIFNIAATILIIGLCVDYGIFTVCRLTEGSTHAADRAVLVSGLTTLAGLGALALARHPSMHSIGMTVLLGIGTGIPAALLVIPALCREEES